MKVEKLPSGNYSVRVIIGHDDSGKPIRKRFTHHDKKHLLSVAHSYADKHRNVSRRMTVEQSIDAFLAAKTPVLSPSTVRAYTSLSKSLKANHASFCGLYVDNIRRSDMQKLVNAIAADHSPKTVRNVCGFLSAAAMYQGERLPPVTLPQKQKPVIHIPDEDIAKKISEAAKGTRLEVPVALAFFALRRSEICALSPEDLTGDVLHIHKAAVYGADKAIHVKNPKTHTSDRYVRIPSALAAKIREQGYVTDFTPAGLSHAYTRMLAAAGLPHYRLHDLRHFFVSYCHNVLHLSDAQIQSITGHKTSVVMQNYLHSMGDDAAGRIVVDSLSNLL